MTFSTFSFDSRINAGISACGYSTPTPIQAQTIPLVLEGCDVMGLAQTGTGKTAAFALPILKQLLERGSSRKGPSVLVLAPTRELALQIRESFTSLGTKTNIRSCAVIGGVGMQPQIRACRESQVIVACPGRLVHLLRDGVVNLNNIDTLVLDEADRMLDMGFMPDIKRIIAKLPPKRQNLLFSATMPDDIRKFAGRILQEPKVVRIDTSTPVTSIEHVFYKTHKSQKTELLKKLLSDSGHQNMLIFTRTKHQAKRLSKKLSNDGYNAVSLQGNMSQNQRQRALKGFQEGRCPIMVATDIAARGIDCDKITHVINYDMPDTVETYTHRVGRTGRAGRSGSAISLIGPDESGQARTIQRVMNLNVEQKVDENLSKGRVRVDSRPTPRNAAPKPNQRKRRRPSRRQNAAA